MDLLNAEIKKRLNKDCQYEIIVCDNDRTEVLFTCPDSYGVVEAEKVANQAGITLRLLKLSFGTQTPSVQVNKEPFKKGDLVQLIKSDKEPRLLKVVFKIREIGRVKENGVFTPIYKIAGYFNGRTITLVRTFETIKFYDKSKEGE